MRSRVSLNQRARRALWPAFVAARKRGLTGRLLTDALLAAPVAASVPRAVVVRWARDLAERAA
jgi:hypothetical protein